MAYYTLVTKDRSNQPHWCIQFGDYDRKVVQQEREDSYADMPARIVKTKTARQEEIELAVGRL